MATDWRRRAAKLCTARSLTFYVLGRSSRRAGVPRVSADSRLVETGLAESASEVVRRLRLSAAP